jgi:hypothetical protein
MSVDDERSFKRAKRKRNEKQNSETRSKLDPVVRRGCLWSWLLLIVLESLYAIYLNYSMLVSNSQPAQPYIFTTGVLVTVGHLIGAIGLYCLRRWGFYCIVAATALMFIVDTINGISWLAVPTGLLNVFVVFFLLRAGGSDCIWRYLK